MRSVVIQTGRHFHEIPACYVSFKNKANKESFEDDISFRTLLIWVKTQITFFPLHHVWILLSSSGTKPWNLFSDLLKLFYHSIHKLSLKLPFLLQKNHNLRTFTSLTQPAYADRCHSNFLRTTWIFSAEKHFVAIPMCKGLQLSLGFYRCGCHVWWYVHKCWHWSLLKHSSQAL